MADAFDYVVVGGGSRGRGGRRPAVRGSRRLGLSARMGRHDVGNDDVLLIRRWLGLLEGPIDLAYHTTLQPRGNAHIVHSRAKVLGGCSSHNTMIWFKPFPGDWRGLGQARRDRVGHRRRWTRTTPGIPGPHQIVGRDRSERDPP